MHQLCTIGNMKVKKSYLDAVPVKYPTVYLVYSQLKLYHLSWLIKRHNIFDPVKGIDFEIELNSGQNVSVHTTFCCQNTDNDIIITLISNKGTQGNIYNQKPPADYIVIISGDPEWNFEELFFNQLKKLPEITAILQLDVTNPLISRLSSFF